MLYLAFPDDPRGFFKEEEATWLVYDTMIRETEFEVGDIVVITHWMFSDTAALVEVLENIRVKGARVIYLGTANIDTEQWRKQLIMAGVYDFLFVQNELNLGDVKKLIEKSRGATAHREVVNELAHNTEPPQIVEYTVEVPKDQEKVAGQITVQTETVPVIMPSRLIAVTGAWRRSGTSFLSMSIAHLLAEEINRGQVQLVEYPYGSPYYMTYLPVENTSEYVHWSQDGAGTPYEANGVTIHPLPEKFESMDANAKVDMATFLFRQLRKSFVVVDAGTLDSDDSLFNNADDIIYVMEPEPALLDSEVSMDRFKSFAEKYGNVHLVINKTTEYSRKVKIPSMAQDGASVRAVKFRSLFPSGIFVPYVNPEWVQKAAWAGTLPTSMPEVESTMDDLKTKLIHQWIPKELQRRTKRRRWRKGKA